MTSLAKQARHLVASAIAAESIDSRDWMRPIDAPEMLERAARVLGVPRSTAESPPRSSLTEALGRPVWIDFLADTGDDRDVSLAVARMLFGRYVFEGQELPRGDLLMWGGDTAYPVATAEEIHKRVIQPYSEALGEAEAGPPRARRVLLGIPGNHDWYDGLDGFCRMFRAAADAAIEAPGQAPARAPEQALRVGRKRGLVARAVHLDEVGSMLGMARDLAGSVRALWRGGSVKRRPRLALPGYTPVQESSFFCLPLAPGLDLYAVDRQLSRVDFRQRQFFRKRRVAQPDARVLFVAPDPAIAFGERWDHGARSLVACGLGLTTDDVLFLTGDMHQYERRAVARSLHVIAGGGGAFLHGTRISPSPSGPAACAYPDGRTSRRLVLQVPLRLMLGGAGFLVHLGFALIGAIEMAASHYGGTAWWITTAALSLVLAISAYVNAGHKRAHPRLVFAASVPFGIALGLLPTGLRLALGRLVPTLAGDGAVVLVYAFLAALVFGLFMTVLTLVGLEHQQSFSALGHPGFKHFVRMRVQGDGTIDAWVIGKDDPLSEADPVVIDRFSWPTSGPDPR